MAQPPKAGLNALLTPQDSVLILIATSPSNSPTCTATSQRWS
jgi:hypothetical protein